MTHSIKACIVFIAIICNNLIAQIPVPGNRVEFVIKPKVDFYTQSKQYRFSYPVFMKGSSQQNLAQFWILLPKSPVVSDIDNPSGWFSVDVTNENDTTWIQWGSDSAHAFAPNSISKGFNFRSPSPPGIIPFYLEGWTPILDIKEEQLDSTGRIPGYNDLTPYGGGIIGKTIGPVKVPRPFIHLNFLDALIFYKNQSVVLGWLGSKKEDKNNKEKEDGDLKELDKRLAEARKVLVKGDSSKVRKELEELVEKVEEIYKESVKTEEKKKEREVVMTSEAYALLKFNANYLIERLPKKKK